MQVVQNDTLGLLIHVHSKYHTLEAQRLALETADVRGTIEVKASAKDIEAVIPRPCPGRTYAVLWLSLVNIKRGDAKQKRERIMAFVDYVREKGAEILEIGSGRRTSDTKERRAMLSDAFEAVARGRQPSHTAVRGRQKRKWSDAQKDIIWQEWFSVRNEENDDAAKAASKRLGFAVDQFVMWHVVRDMKRAAGEPNATGASGRPFRKATKR
jgi:hypothetical protein